LTTSSRTLRPPLPFPTRRSSDLDGVQTAFELAHQFNDGDSNDLALAYGDSVPYRLPMIASGALLQNIPNDHQQQFFATLTICTPGPMQSVRDLAQNVQSLSGSGALSPKNADT